MVSASPTGIVCDVEGMVLRCIGDFETTLYDESVVPASYYVQLGNELSVDPPGDTPAFLA